MDNSFKDIVLMLPDSILFGSFFLGLITISQQHLLLFASLLEGLFLLKGFQSIATFMNGSQKLNPDKCKSKFQGLTFSNLSEFFHSDSISYGVYLFTLASSYFVNSRVALKDELEVLDSSYLIQTNVIMYILLGLSLTYAIVKVVLECDSLTSVSLALILGLIMGIFLVYQNIHLFNKNTINFMGIPLLRNKTANNQPIYICSQ